jgi:hypothetical protein
MMLKPKRIRRSGWGKGPDNNNKKGTNESAKDKGGVGCVMDWKGTVHHELLPHDQVLYKQLYQEVLARLRDAVRRNRCELWGKPDLDVASRQCAGPRVAPHPQLSGYTSNIRCSPSTPFSTLSPSELFPVSQT